MSNFQIDQIADQVSNFEYYKFKNNTTQEEDTIAIFDRAGNKHDSNNSKYNGADLVYKRGADGQYQRLSGQEAQEYAKQAFQWGHALPSKTEFDRSQPGYVIGQINDGTRVAFGTKQDNKDWAWLGAKGTDGKTKWSPVHMDERSPDWLKAARSSATAVKAPESETKAEVPDSTKTEQQDTTGAYPKLKTTEWSTTKDLNLCDVIKGKVTTHHQKVDDSSSAVKAALKQGGTDLNDPMTQVCLTKDLVATLLPEDQLRVLADPFNMQGTIAKILQERDPQTGSRKGLDAIGQLYLNDPIKGAATALMLADRAEDAGTQKDLNQLAASFYESATTGIKDMRSYETSKKIALRYHNDISLKPEASRSPAQREFLENYGYYQATEASYGAKSVSLDRLEDAIFYYRQAIKG